MLDLVTKLIGSSTPCPLSQIFYFLCFITLVIYVVLDFDNVAVFDLQFLLTLVAFIAYLVYLSGNYNIIAMSCDAKFSGIFSKYIALPDDIKNIIVTEMNQYINIMKGMKDAAGKDPVEQLVDKDYYLKNKDPDLVVNGVIQDKALADLQEDYFSIDKVFRDLQIANHELYMTKVYTTSI